VFLKLNTFLDLIKYCIRQNIPFTEFEDWSSISATVKDIVSGKVNLKDVAVSGAREARHGK
jgi:2-hydroxy-3-keto-5-methylthiopentenyl-1-phosphate phosphatase